MRLTRRRRLCSPEPLEARLALDGSFAPLGADAYLTLSFAPDGTSVAGRASDLAATFAPLGSEAQWQDTILRAFQTWVVHANADVGLVADSGLALGTPGSTRDDPRFGDIRIAGVAMAPEIGAISVPIDSVLSGTWHADIVFNTAFPYRSLDDVFAIALHEAGNVLGLEDNNDPMSPLRAGPIPTAIVPTATDLALLRSLHGARGPDINELDDGDLEANDTRATATDWDPSTAGGLPPGALPAVAQGDLQTASDVDYFALEIPEGYSGPLTVTLRTDGVSLLRGGLRLEDSAGGLLGQATGAGDRGDRVSVTLPAATSGSTVFVRVSAATTGLYGVGGFALAATFDAANTATAAEIERATDGELRLVDVVDFQQLIASGEEAFRNDLGLNDTPGGATPLQGSVGFAAGARFETVASIGVVGDVDYYRVAPANGPGSRAYVTLRSLDRGRLVPTVEAFDELGSPLASRVLVNGAGELLVEIDTTGLPGDLVLRVAASPNAGPFVRGNYALAAGFVDAQVALTEFAAGSLAGVSSVAEHTLYAAEPQLFHFVLNAQGPLAPQNASVETEIVDAAGVVVHRIAAPLGESRSAGAVFLAIGEYTVRASVVALGDSVAGPVSYSLRGAPFSDPFVGDGSDPTTNPFSCGGTNEGFYCYPGGIVSSDPFLWNDFVASLAESPTPGDTAEEVRRLLGDWWSWVWASLGVNGPPLAVSDDFTPPAGSRAQQPTGFAFSGAPPNVLANDVEPELDPVVAVLALAPQNGTVTLRPDGTFEYTPNPGFVGFDWFRYTSFDFGTPSNAATVWVTVAGSATLPGDFNGDGVVAQADADFWRANYGESGGPADANRDGLVDAADYTTWRDNVGATAASRASLSTSAPSSPGVGAIDAALGSIPTVATPVRRGAAPRREALIAPPVPVRLALLLDAGPDGAAREEAFARLEGGRAPVAVEEPAPAGPLRAAFRPAARR